MDAGSRGFTPLIPVGSSIQFFMCLRSLCVVCWLCAEAPVFARGINNAIKIATANISRPTILILFFIGFPPFGKRWKGLPSKKACEAANHTRRLDLLGFGA